MSNPHCLSMFVSPKLNPKSQLPNQHKHYFLFTIDSNAKEATSFAATLTDSRRIVAKKAVACCQHLPAFPKQKLNPFIQLFTWSLKWFPTVQLSWFAPIGIHHCRPLRHLRKSIQSSPKPKKMANKLKNRFTVKFYWVPDHEWIPRNELADRKARSLTINRKTRIK